MLTDKDKEIIKSGNIGQLTELLYSNILNRNTKWLDEAQEYSKSLVVKSKYRNVIKGLDCLQCPKCGAPMPLFKDKCMAEDCDYQDKDG